MMFLWEGSSKHGWSPWVVSMFNPWHLIFVWKLWKLMCLTWYRDDDDGEEDNNEDNDENKDDNNKKNIDKNDNKKE